MKGGLNNKMICQSCKWYDPMFVFCVNRQSEHYKELCPKDFCCLSGKESDEVIRKYIDESLKGEKERLEKMNRITQCSKYEAFDMFCG